MKIKFVIRINKKYPDIDMIHSSNYRLITQSTINFYCISIFTKKVISYY